MIGLRPIHLMVDVIRPTLECLGGPYNSPSAAQLLLGTAMAESKLMWLHQLGGGPARGLWQMEPNTFDDHIKWLAYDSRQNFQKRVMSLLLSGIPPFSQLAGNLYFACAMARVHYWRVAEPLPEMSDTHGMAQYWKTHYNTAKGKGTVFHYMQLWNDER